jgi:hypothetical protein
MKNNLHYNFFENIQCFMKSISHDTVEFLSWVSSLIVTILTLITIIFTQHNEKITIEIRKLYRELLQDIKNDSNLETTKENIINNFNEISFLLRNRQNYLNSMTFFRWVLYFLAFIWSIASTGMLLNSAGWANKYIIIFSLVILIIVFYFVPKYLSNFNKFEIYSENIDELNTFLCFVEDNSKIAKHTVIDQLISPSVEFSLKHGKIFITFKQNLSLKNFYVVLSLGDNNNSIYIRFTIATPKHSNEFIIEIPSNVTLDGAFDTIKNSNKHRNRIYIIGANNNCHFVYKVALNILDENKLRFTLYEPFTTSLPKPIIESLKKEYDYIEIKTTQGQSNMYKISLNQN